MQHNLPLHCKIGLFYVDESKLSILNLPPRACHFHCHCHFPPRCSLCSHLLPSRSTLFFQKKINTKIETKSFLCHFRSNKKCFSDFLFFSSKKSFWHWQLVVEPSCIEERSSRGTSSFGSHAEPKAMVQDRKGKPTTKRIPLSARPEQASTESMVGRLKADLVTLVRTHKQGYLRELHPPGNFFAEIQEYSIAMQYVDISKERQHWQDLTCDLLKGDKEHIHKQSVKNAMKMTQMRDGKMVKMVGNFLSEMLHDLLVEQRFLGRLWPRVGHWVQPWQKTYCMWQPMTSDMLRCTANSAFRSLETLQASRRSNRHYKKWLGLAWCCA